MALVTPLTAIQRTASSTTSLSLVDPDNTCETSILSNGVKYLVIYCANYSSGNSNGEPEVVLDYGGTVYGRAGAEGETSSAGKTFQFHGEVVVTGDGLNTLKFQFRRTSPTGTVYVDEMSIIAVPLTDFTENTHYWYAEDTNSDAIQHENLTSSFATLQSKTINTTNGRKYLVIGSVEINPGYGSASVGGMARLAVDGVAISHESKIEYEDTDDWHSHTFAVLYEGDGSSEVFSIQAAGIYGGYEDARRARIFVLDTTAFADGEIITTVNADGISGDNSGAWETLCSITTGRSSNPYILLGTLNAGSDTAGEVAQAKLVDGGSADMLDAGVQENDAGFDADRDQLPVFLCAYKTGETGNGTTLQVYDDAAIDFAYGRNSANSAGTISSVILWGLDLPTGATPKSDSDSGSGTDAQTLNVTHTNTETGSGADNQSLEAAQTDSDSGSGVDSTSLAAIQDDADTGVGIDDQSPPEVTLLDTETGSGADNELVEPRFIDSDAGAGVDTESPPVVEINESDTGVGVDSEQLEAVLPDQSDSSTAIVDAESLSVSHTDSDSASGTDDEDVQQGLISKADSDSGSGADDQQLSTEISESDAATGVDAHTGPVIELIDSDSGVGTDDQQLNVANTDADTGVGVDDQNVYQTVPKSDGDSASGTDDELLEITLFNTDSAVGVDAETLDKGLDDSDSAVGVDSEELVVLSSDFDSAIGVDDTQLDVEHVDSDVGAGVDDEFPILVVLTDNDGCVCVDVATLEVVILGSDSGVGVDSELLNTGQQFRQIGVLLVSEQDVREFVVQEGSIRDLIAEETSPTAYWVEERPVEGIDPV